MKEWQAKQYLENLSFITTCQDQPCEPLYRKIFKRLVGTSRTNRLGPFPEKDVETVICENIRKKIKNDEPIQIVSAWGAKKTIPGAIQQVDLAEFFTLVQFLAIAKEIESVYPPGVQYNIFVGDAFYKYLYGKNPDLPLYLSRLRALVETMDVRIFKLTSMEELHEKNSGLLPQCDTNVGMLSQYWHDSSDIPEEAWPKLNSYRNLIKNGWIGTLPSLMREHYLKRLEWLFPNFSLKERISSIIRFFAYGMMVSQNDLFGRKNPQQCTADFCLLRIPPPGIPKHLHGNRLRKRILPEKFSKKTAPPWTVVGTLKYDSHSYKPAIISNGEGLSEEYNTARVNLFDKIEFCF